VPGGASDAGQRVKEKNGNGERSKNA
jgi:hypothetical protein